MEPSTNTLPHTHPFECFHAAMHPFKCHLHSSDDFDHCHMKPHTVSLHLTLSATRNPHFVRIHQLNFMIFLSTADTGTSHIDFRQRHTMLNTTQNCYFASEGHWNLAIGAPCTMRNSEPVHSVNDVRTVNSTNVYLRWKIN